MENPYQPPQTETALKVQPIVKFERAASYLKLTTRWGLILITVGLFLALNPNIFALHWTSGFGFLLAKIGIILLGFSFLSILPMTLWGFIQGRKDAQLARKSRT